MTLKLSERVAPFFALTDVTTCKIRIPTNPSLEYAQSTTPTLNQTMNLHEQETKQSNNQLTCPET